MGSSTMVEETAKEQIKDDISDQQIDLDKLAQLKAKAKQQEGKMAKIIAKKDRSLNFGVVGTGQCGSRIAEAFYKLGYEAVVINTAVQDLKYIEVPDSNKLLLEYGVGGASKELSIGRDAAEKHVGLIQQLVSEKLSTSQVNVLCTSLGGGSGAGSVPVLIDVLNATGNPLVVIAALPMDSEDAQTKQNALETLAELAQATQSKKIQNLIVVDNAKIEAIYHDVSQMEFFNVANKSIVNILDVFNTYSMLPSAIKGIDPMEWSKILIDSEGLTVYGELTVDNYSEDTAIAEAVVSNLNNNLLASEFDLKESKYVGVIIAASKEVWAKIPSVAVNYAMSMVQDATGTPRGVFKGIYSIQTDDDSVKVYSIFSGLGLPKERVEVLKKDAKQKMDAVKVKDENRNLSLNLDTGVNKTVSNVDKIKEKIASKASAFGKFTSTVVDRRK